MKKVVRLTESDLVRIVKKVLSENKQNLNEDSPPVDTGSGGNKLAVVNGNLQFVRGDGIKCTYKVLDNKNGGLLKFKSLILVPGKLYDDYVVEFNNKTGDHKNSVPKKLVNSLVGPGFGCQTKFDASVLGYGGTLVKV